MGRAELPAGLRRRLLLWAAVVGLAGGLLAMGQLSFNHTAARSITHAVAVTADLGEHHDHTTAEHGPAPDPAGAAAQRTVGHLPLSEEAGCSGCAEHHGMALTCLGALILLTMGWALPLPAVWRGVLLPWILLAALPRFPLWRRPSLSLVQLSISRT